MPKVRKLTVDEVRQIERRIKGQRKLVEEEYDLIMGSYTIGEYGEAELSEDENRITVRNRLKAAATRANLALDFKRTKGNILRFKVQQIGDVSENEKETSSVSAKASAAKVIVDGEAPPKRRGGRPRKVIATA